MKRLTGVALGLAIAAGIGFPAPAGGVPGRAPLQQVEAQDEEEECPWSANVAYHDFVLGSPRRPVRGVRQAGAVEIRSQENRSLLRTLTSSKLGKAEQPKGWFGASVAALTSDEIEMMPDLLVIGMPGANGGRGAVVVVPDFGSGLEPAKATWLPTAAVGLRRGDRLGAALAVEHISSGAPGAGCGAVIVAGAPGRDAPGARDAGALVSWTVPFTEGAPSRQLKLGRPVVHAEGVGGLPGRAERHNRFGSVLSMSPLRDGAVVVTVGVPDDDIGGKRDAGSVTMFTLAGGRVSEGAKVWQGHGLPGRSARGDRLGAALEASSGPLRPSNRLVLIGVPGKDANRRKDSGAVIAWVRGTGRSQVITQNTRGVPDRSERGDAFGSALAFVDGQTNGESTTVAVGAPGEDVRGRRDAGAVTFMEPAGETLTPMVGFWTQEVRGLAKGDRFGSRFVTALDDLIALEDEVYVAGLAIGAPGEDLRRARNAGRYYVGGSRYGVGDERHQLKPQPAVHLADGAARNERFGG